MPAFHDDLPEELEATTRQMTAQLEHLYQQPTLVTGILPNEQEHILARARARLLASSATLTELEKDARPALVLVSPPTDNLLPAPPPPANPRQKRLARLLNTLVAILMVALFGVGFSLVFAHHPASTESRPATLKSPSTLPCFLVPDADPGLVVICDQRLYQDMHVVSVDHQFRATLTRAYADRNRVVVSLRFEMLVQGRYTTASTNFGTFYAGLHISLQTPQEQVFPGLGTSSEEIPTDNEWVAAFAVPATLTLPAELHFHLLAQSFVGGVLPSTQPSFNIKLALDFTLPLHSELRTISVNQTQMINGMPMTLQELRISPSVVVLALTYQNISAFAQVWHGVVLTLGRTNCSNFLNSPYILDPQGPGGPLFMQLTCPLYQARGPGKLVFKDSTSGKLLGVFTFDAS